MIHSLEGDTAGSRSGEKREVLGKDGCGMEMMNILPFDKLPAIKICSDSTIKAFKKHFPVTSGNKILYYLSKTTLLKHSCNFSFYYH